MFWDKLVSDAASEALGAKAEVCCSEPNVDRVLVKIIWHSSRLTVGMPYSGVIGLEKRSFKGKKTLMLLLLFLFQIEKHGQLEVRFKHV